MGAIAEAVIMEVPKLLKTTDDTKTVTMDVRSRTDLKVNIRTEDTIDRTVTIMGRTARDQVTGSDPAMDITPTELDTLGQHPNLTSTISTMLKTGSTLDLETNSPMRQQLHLQEAAPQEIRQAIPPIPAARVAPWTVWGHSLSQKRSRLMDSMVLETLRNTRPPVVACWNSRLSDKEMGTNIKDHLHHHTKTWAQEYQFGLERRVGTLEVHHQHPRRRSASPGLGRSLGGRLEK